ncbi:MAG: peptidoglycan-binding domain-containing protein [Verrucomicrobiota bacterium]
MPGVYPWAYSDWGYGGYDYGYAPTVSLPAVGGSLASDVQSQLAQLGYYNGPIDGIVGSGTRAAIRAYQADNGLPVNGLITSSLTASLGL